MIQVAFIWTNKLKMQHRRNIKNLKSHHTERDISGAYRGSTRRRRPPLLSGRGSRHTSASLTGRSLTPRRCTAQHSCLLSVSSDLDLFLPQSLPALCLLSMIVIYLWPDVSLKVFCHNLKWTTTARRRDLSTLGVRSGIIVTNGELLR